MPLKIFHFPCDLHPKAACNIIGQGELFKSLVWIKIFKK